MKIAANAILTGLITSSTIMISIGSTGVGMEMTSFLIAACMSGILAAAKELKEEINEDGESRLSMLMLV